MSNDETQFILGSASPRRREILRALGLRFRVEPSRILEPAPSMGERPERYALRVARAKAEEVSGKHHSGLVIGADTVVVLGRRILGKPLSAEEARTMLRALSGRWHEVITALCLIDCRSRQRRSSRTVSRVHFRRLSAPEMEWYLTTKEYQDKGRSGWSPSPRCGSAKKDRPKGFGCRSSIRQGRLVSRWFALSRLQASASFLLPNNRSRFSSAQTAASL